MLEDEASDDPGVIGLVRGQSRHQQVTRSGNGPDRRRHPLVERVEPEVLIFHEVDFTSVDLSQPLSNEI